MDPQTTSRTSLMIAGTIALLLSLASGGGVQATQPVKRAATPATARGNAANGARLYQACMGCHAIDENDVGPRHRGVVGRRAGSVPDYAYSAALKASGIVWTNANLDRWLSGPQAMVPGAKMYFSIAGQQDRADIIAFLATQK